MPPDTGATLAPRPGLGAPGPSVDRRAKWLCDPPQGPSQPVGVVAHHEVSSACRRVLCVVRGAFDPDSEEPITLAGIGLPRAERGDQRGRLADPPPRVRRQDLYCHERLGHARHLGYQSPLLLTCDHHLVRSAPEAAQLEGDEVGPAPEQQGDLPVPPERRPDEGRFCSRPPRPRATWEGDALLEAQHHLVCSRRAAKPPESPRSPYPGHRRVQMGRARPRGHHHDPLRARQGSADRRKCRGGGPSWHGRIAPRYDDLALLVAHEPAHEPVGAILRRLVSILSSTTSQEYSART